MEKRIPRAERADGIRSRQAILSTAARLATVEGLNGLSIGRLAEHIGMSKSGLYAHFGSKEELQLATIATATEVFEAAVTKTSLSFPDPVEQIKALCNGFLEYVGDRVFPGGCFFIAVAAEFDTHPGPVRARVREILDWWRSLFVGLVESAQEAGSIDASEDPHQVAFEIDAFMVKANLDFVLHDEEQYLERARSAIRSRLEQAAPRQRTG